MKDIFDLAKEERIKRIIEMIPVHHGNVSALCADMGISRSVFYKYKADHPEIDEKLEEVREDTREKVAHKLIEDALNGNTTAQIFFLKTQAGWSETRKIEMDAKVEDRRLEKGTKQWEEFQTLMDRLQTGEDEDEGEEDDEAPF